MTTQRPAVQQDLPYTECNLQILLRSKWHLRPKVYAKVLSALTWEHSEHTHLKYVFLLLCRCLSFRHCHHSWVWRLLHCIGRKNLWQVEHNQNNHFRVKTHPSKECRVCDWHLSTSKPKKQKKPPKQLAFKYQWSPDIKFGHYQIYNLMKPPWTATVQALLRWISTCASQSKHPLCKSDMPLDKCIDIVINEQSSDDS